jgi:hypothetical protein
MEADSSRRQPKQAMTVSNTTQSIQTTGMPEGNIVANMCGFKFHKDTSVDISLYATGQVKEHVLAALPTAPSHSQQSFVTLTKRE